jgi:hypothetical protein
MLQGAELCETAEKQGIAPAEAEQLCRELGESSGPRIDRILSQFGPALSPSGDFALGYTLTVPLLRYFTQANGEWKFDQERLAHTLSSIEAVNRPVVVYLFSTHFAADENPASLEQTLADDPANLMMFSDGRPAQDTYFQTTINPWTIADMNAPINQYREQGLKQALDALCALPDEARQRIVGINLLGEVHHFFPNFFSGMGYETGMNSTDYGPASVAAFQQFLREKFGSIYSANRALQTTFPSFEAIRPPSKDIRTEGLSDFTEHLDPYAHGTFPVGGWASGETPPFIRVYLNGAEVAAGPATAGRQDVLEAKPELGTANVGFRFDVPFQDQPPGIHRLVVEGSVNGSTYTIADQRIIIMSRDQAAPSQIPSHPLPVSPVIVGAAPFSAWLDMPQAEQSFFYNPLADLWLQFRNKQVADYVEHFASVAGESCFGRETLFSHQIAPRFNASWNADLIAVDQALKPSPLHGLGINLYGGAAYGDTFFEWQAQHGHTRYGVPEFHTMRAMSPEAIADMFERHKASGAAYIAPYFVMLTPETFFSETDTSHRRFMISPANDEYGSSSLFRGIQELMKR